MKQEYRDILEFPPTLLYKKDLFTLEEILKDSQQNITNETQINLSYKDISLKVNSFEELFNCQNLPKSTDKLTIKCQGWVGIDCKRNIDRGISLTLYHSYIHCQIHSFEEDWYRGKSSRLNSFFKQKRPWYAIFNKIYSFFIVIAPGILFYTIYLFKLRNYIVAVARK